MISKVWIFFALFVIVGTTVAHAQSGMCWVKAKVLTLYPDETSEKNVVEMSVKIIESEPKSEFCKESLVGTWMDVAYNNSKNQKIYENEIVQGFLSYDFSSTIDEPRVSYFISLEEKNE